MTALASLLVVLSLSILVTKVATIALTHTGLSTESARFQARSAFTGAGFTTSESERVVHHPVRRRIIVLLMLAGNAGIVTAVSSLMLAFIDGGGDSWAPKIALLVVGIGALWLVVRSSWVDRKLVKVIEWALGRFTDLDVRDYGSLLHLRGDYRLVELIVREDDWIVGKTLRESELRDEGINVLGIERRDGHYVGTPTADTRIEARDKLIVYGHLDAINALDERHVGFLGDLEHRAAISEHDRKAENKAEERMKERSTT